MKERPILFSAPMVRAILAGTKTQTRRIVKAQPNPDISPTFQGLKFVDGFWRAHFNNLEITIPRFPSGIYVGQFNCPYGKPGDRLWVKETWRTVAEANGIPPRDLTNVESFTHYEADGPDRTMGKLRPSIFMPRWASRITLEVAGIRVERLQDISEADARAEGTLSTRMPNGINWSVAQVGYKHLWESINGPGSWDANPWVWVVEFSRMQKEGA